MCLRRGLQWAIAVTRWTRECSRWGRWQGALSDAACFGMSSLSFQVHYHHPNTEWCVVWGWGGSGALANLWHAFLEESSITSCPLPPCPPPPATLDILRCCFVSGSIKTMVKVSRWTLALGIKKDACILKIPPRLRSKWRREDSRGWTPEKSGKL